MTFIPYTNSERTQKRYTVGQAIEIAKLYLANKYSLTQVCVNKIRSRQNEETITLVELNKITEDLIDDTMYYDGWKAVVRH